MTIDGDHFIILISSLFFFLILCSSCLKHLDLQTELDASKLCNLLALWN